jgi:hypothetical protein
MLHVSLHHVHNSLDTTPANTHVLLISLDTSSILRTLSWCRVLHVVLVWERIRNKLIITATESIPTTTFRLRSCRYSPSQMLHVSLHHFHYSHASRFTSPRPLFPRYNTGQYSCLINFFGHIFNFKNLILVSCTACMWC